MSGQQPDVSADFISCSLGKVFREPPRFRSSLDARVAACAERPGLRDQQINSHKMGRIKVDQNLTLATAAQILAMRSGADQFAAKML